MSTTITTTNTLTANDANIEDVEDADDGSVEEETSPDIPARRTRSRGPARSPGPLPGSSRRRATLTEDIPDLPLDQPEVPAEQPPPEGGPGLDYAAISQTLVWTVQQRNCKGLFLFHILSPVAFCYLPSFMSFSILDFSQV